MRIRYTASATSEDVTRLVAELDARGQHSATYPIPRTGEYVELVSPRDVGGCSGDMYGSSSQALAVVRVTYTAPVGGTSVSVPGEVWIHLRPDP